MNIFNLIKDELISVAINTFPEANLTQDEFNKVVVESPNDAQHGDVSSNIAMVLTKRIGKSPREIASKITEIFSKTSSHTENVSIAGAGFINMNFKQQTIYDVATNILQEKSNFGASNVGHGIRVNVEYVSANPTGPMHIGHARNAIIGDVLANLLIKAGFEVTKEYYINDAGAQIGILSRSLMLRYKELCGIDIGEIPQGLYPGEYLIEVAQKIKDKFGDDYKNADEAPKEFIDIALHELMGEIKSDLASVNIHHDVFTSEKKLKDEQYIQKAINYLDKQGLIYRGILEPPKGKLPDDWEEREQLLFKATEFGDDTDRPLEKSDGSHTYFAGDMAYHLYKVERDFDELVVVLGADHGGYVKRLKAIVKSLSVSREKGEVKCDILLSQLVKIMDNDTPVKMSKRAGNFILMSDIVKQIGKDVLRFIILTRKSDASLDFDLKKVVETTKENPVFYCQYAYARINSVLRTAKSDFNIDYNTLTQNNDVTSKLLNLLAHPEELSLLKYLATYPKLLESAALNKEPHKITYYLTELSAKYHQLWNLGVQEDIKFIDNNNLEKTKARILLNLAVMYVMKSGFDILGVTAIEKM